MILCFASNSSKSISAENDSAEFDLRSPEQPAVCVSCQPRRCHVSSDLPTEDSDNRHLRRDHVAEEASHHTVGFALHSRVRRSACAVVPRRRDASHFGGAESRFGFRRCSRCLLPVWLRRNLLRENVENFRSVGVDEKHSAESFKLAALAHHFVHQRQRRNLQQRIFLRLRSVRVFPGATASLRRSHSRSCREIRRQHSQGFCHITRHRAIMHRLDLPLQLSAHSSVHIRHYSRHHLSFSLRSRSEQEQQEHEEDEQHSRRRRETSLIGAGECVKHDDKGC